MFYIDYCFGAKVHEMNQFRDMTERLEGGDLTHLDWIESR